MGRSQGCRSGICWDVQIKFSPDGGEIIINLSSVLSFIYHSALHKVVYYGVPYTDFRLVFFCINILFFLSLLLCIVSW